MLHSKFYFGYKYVMLIAAVKCRGDNEATMDSHNDRLSGAFQLVRVLIGNCGGKGDV